MKLKTRLIITFFVIACVPLAMAAIALFGFSQIQIRSMEAKFGITDVTYDTLSNSMQLINSITSSAFESMKKAQIKIRDDSWMNPIRKRSMQSFRQGIPI